MVDFKVIGTRDLTYPPAARRAFDVEIPAGHIEDDDLMEVVKRILGESSERRHHTTAFFFWQPGQKVGHQKARAKIIWAPFGRWEDAHLASNFSFYLEFNETR